MAIKIIFTLSVNDGKFDDVISNIRRMNELELREDADRKGDIICSVEVSGDNAERTANLCGSMCNIEGLKSMKVLVTTIPDKKVEKSSR